MKGIEILMVFAIFFLFSIHANAYALLLSDDPVADTDLVVVGTIVTATPKFDSQNYPVPETEYVAYLEEMIKGGDLLEDENKTKSIRFDSPGSVDYDGPFHRGSYKIFNVGDRALLMLNQKNGTFKESLWSRTTESDCSGNELIQLMNAPAGLHLFQNNKDYSPFYTNQTITAQYYLYNKNLTASTVDVTLDVIPGFPAIHHPTSLSLNLDKCQAYAMGETEFVIEKPGSFSLYSIVNGEEGDSFGGIKVIDHIEPPRKQFSSGISVDKIQCKSNLVLSQKRDGSPACVTAKTKLKLIERGWAIQDFIFSESLKNEILDQLRKGVQNVNGTAKDFVVFEAIHDKSLSGILKDSEYQVNCCSYSVDDNSFTNSMSIGITFQIDEKRMIVTAKYDLQQEKIASIATFPIKSEGFVSFSEESENNGVYTTMKPNTMEFFYYPDASSATQEPYRLFMLIRLPEWMGGGANDASAFRAYSAKSLDDPCIVKYWPQEGRQRIENPCQGGMYRVIDGTITLGLTHRSTAMTALPHLDLSIDEEGGLYVDTPSWTKTENGVIGYGRDMSLDEIRRNSEFLLDSFENSYPEYPKIPLSFAGYLLSEIYPERDSVTVWYLDFPNKSGNISMSIDKLSHTDYTNLTTPHSEFWKIGDTMIKISGFTLDKNNELPEQYKTYTIEFNDGFDFHIEGKNLEFIKKEIIANYFPEYSYDDLLFISRNN